MPIQETVFCCVLPAGNSTGSGLISLHDIQTGTTLASFKPTNSTPHSVTYVESRPGLGGMILAAQTDKPFINVFNFQKVCAVSFISSMILLTLTGRCSQDQLSSKLILGEKLTSLALNYSGDYCAGGTSNGRIYLWEVRKLKSPITPLLIHHFVR